MRLYALTKKEALQIFRDPSSLIIAFILPMLLLFLFGYGISLDAKEIPFGIALEDSGYEARDLARQFYGSKYFIPDVSTERQDLLPHLVSDKLKAVLVIPNGFSASLHSGREASVGLIIDGTFPNTGAIIQNFGLGAVSLWAAQNGGAATPVGIASRYWYNNEIDSRYSIIPGIMAMIMALIGTMLTSLVVAREWERGTMEALLSTPLNAFEILLGKLIPYYLLAILSTFLSLGISVWLYKVPYRGSIFMLFCVGSLFMLSALGQGLIISTITKNQFLASFGALLSAFQPTIFLSDFLFEVNSMPLPQRILSSILPSRYLVACLQTLFLAGNVWEVLIPNMLKLTALGVFFIGITLLKTPKRL